MSKNLVAPKERDVQRLILDWLAVKRIWHVRLNTGAMAGSYKGKKWFVRFGKPGMADVVAVRYDYASDVAREYMMQVVWIEVKSPTGRQSDDQRRFQKEVEAQGMTYILARDLRDVEEVLG